MSEEINSNDTKQHEKTYVWEFTNQRKLNKKEFVQYFEKKVFKTIRKYTMLPQDKIILLASDNRIETEILKKILKQKFTVKESKKPNMIAKSATEISEITFKNILGGTFNGPNPQEKPCNPFYFHTDDEINLYAELKQIKGKKREPDKKVQELLEKFYKKNKDTEHNILKALNQIQQSLNSDNQ